MVNPFITPEVTTCPEKREGSNQGENTLEEAALEYAQCGFPVFPLHSIDCSGSCSCPKGPSCQHPGKHPRTRHGFWDATTETLQISKWWGLWPDANIGVPTGPESGILALDVDTAGFNTLIALEKQRGPLPKTAMTKTGRGGRHYLFQYPAGESIGNSVGKLGIGLDIRGHGGYVVVPPSRTESTYEWLESLPIAELPAWLLEDLREPSRPVPREASPHSATRTMKHSDPIPEGTRNRTLFELGCSRRGRGYDESKVLAELRSINANYCSPPLDDAEVSKIAASAARYQPGTGNAPDTETLAALAEIETGMWRRKWQGRSGKTDRDVYFTLIKAAREYGQRIPAGVRVSIGVRDLALKAAVSKRTAHYSVKRLREANLIRRDGSGTESLAGAFVLLTCADLHHSTTGGGSGRNGAILRAPRLRWSAPEIRRLGKTCGQIIDALESGSLTLEELAAKVGITRPRDMRRRHLSRLEEAAVVECFGENVSLAPGWEEALQVERERAGEIAAEERDKDKYARERVAYACRHENLPTAVLEPNFQVRVPSSELTDADGYTEDLKPFEGPSLTPSELSALEAIRAYERERGVGSFSWDQASCKRLFYSREGRGHWPDPDELERIRAFVDGSVFLEDVA